MAKDKITIGNVEVTALSDGVLEFDPCNFFPLIPSESWQPYEDSLTAQHEVQLNLGSFLIRSGGHNILVDTGLGPRPEDAPESPWGELLNDISNRGISLNEIDMVVMTHLHRDHVAWNMVYRGGKYQPTFPNARYWMSAKDLEACKNPELKERFPNASTYVWPLEAMGLVEVMDGESNLTSELTTLPTPGHTPGHMSLLITSGGEHALILGDAAHTPVQLHEIDWCSRADMDPEQTRVTRRSLIDWLERDGMVVGAGHFPPPGFGKIVRLEGRRYWQAL